MYAAMSVKEETVLLQQIKLRLKKLSPERLRVANDFLAYLEEREESEATQEPLAILDFSPALQSAKRQAKAGQVVRTEGYSPRCMKCYRKDASRARPMNRLAYRWCAA